MIDYFLNGNLYCIFLHTRHKICPRHITLKTSVLPSRLSRRSIRTVVSPILAVISRARLLVSRIFHRRETFADLFPSPPFLFRLFTLRVRGPFSRQEPEPPPVVLRRADQPLANLPVRADLLAEVGDDLERGGMMDGGKVRVREVRDVARWDRNWSLSETVPFTTMGDGS